MFESFVSEYKTERRKAEKDFFQNNVKRIYTNTKTYIIDIFLIVVCLVLTVLNAYFILKPLPEICVIASSVILVGLAIVMIGINFRRYNRKLDTTKTKQEFQKVIINPILIVLANEAFEEIRSLEGLEWLSLQVSGERERIPRCKSILDLFIEIILFPSLVSLGCIFIQDQKVPKLILNLPLYLNICLIVLTIAFLLLYVRDISRKNEFMLLSQLECGLEYLRLVKPYFYELSGEKTDLDVSQLAKSIGTLEGIKDLIENHPEKEGLKISIKEIVDSLNIDYFSSLKMRQLNTIKYQLMEIAMNGILKELNCIAHVQKKDLKEEGDGTCLDIIVENNTNNQIEVFGEVIKPCKTLYLECLCGRASYLRKQLYKHIPQKLSNQEEDKLLLMTSDIKDISPGLVNDVCERYRAKLIILNVSDSNINGVIMMC